VKITLLLHLLHAHNHLPVDCPQNGGVIFIFNIIAEVAVLKSILLSKARPQITGASVDFN
jgi:hypothetical protein